MKDNLPPKPLINLIGRLQAGEKISDEVLLLTPSRDAAVKLLRENFSSTAKASRIDQIKQLERMAFSSNASGISSTLLSECTKLIKRDEARIAGIIEALESDPGSRDSDSSSTETFEPRANYPLRKVLSYALTSVVCIAIGALAGQASTTNQNTSYQALASLSTATPTTSSIAAMMAERHRMVSDWAKLESGPISLGRVVGHDFYGFIGVRGDDAKEVCIAFVDTSFTRETYDTSDTDSVECTDESTFEETGITAEIPTPLATFGQSDESRFIFWDPSNDAEVLTD